MLVIINVFAPQKPDNQIRHRFNDHMNFFQSFDFLAIIWITIEYSRWSYIDAIVTIMIKMNIYRKPWEKTEIKKKLTSFCLCSCSTTLLTLLDTNRSRIFAISSSAFGIPGGNKPKVAIREFPWFCKFAGIGGLETLLAITGTFPGWWLVCIAWQWMCKLVLSGNAQLQHRHINIREIWCFRNIWARKVSLPKFSIYFFVLQNFSTRFQISVSPNWK